MFVCFVPRSHLEAVQEALWTVGAGVIGEYSKCSFVLDGIVFLEGSAAAPTRCPPVTASVEQATEARGSKSYATNGWSPEAASLAAQAHPHEEPACDVYPLKGVANPHGSGRMGLLTAADPDSADAHPGMSLADFLALVKTKFAVIELPFVKISYDRCRGVVIALRLWANFFHSDRKEM